MTTDGQHGVLLLSSFPEAHRAMLEAMRHRGIPAQIARGGNQVARGLEPIPFLVLVDLVYGVSLDAISIQRINGLRRSTTVLALHDGNLGGFADHLSDLVVDGFCRIGEWVPIVDLAYGTHRSPMMAPLN